MWKNFDSAYKEICNRLKNIGFHLKIINRSTGEKMIKLKAPEGIFLNKYICEEILSSIDIMIVQLIRIL